jgi:MYXO-CTERM domain-containing protein
MVLVLALPGIGAAAPGAPTAEAPPVLRAIEPDDVRINIDEATDEESAARAQQGFSTLGALALGILGLLWMRRRAAAL